MKKILLFILAGLLIGFSNSNAQCTFSNPSIRLISPFPYTNAQGKCVVTFELSFDILHNPGGKYFWVHLWPSNSYPDYSYPQSHPPTTSIIPGGNGALDNSIATFGFFHQQGALDIQSAYPPDNNAPNFQSGYILSEIENGGINPGSDRYTLTGLSITLPLDCSIPQSFTADLWESQSAQAQTVACVSKGVVVYANDPKVSGFLFCQLPRTYSFTVTSINTAGMTINYKVYIDNGDGIFNKTTDTINVASGNDIQLQLNNITHNYEFISGVMSYLPYSNQKPYADRALWISVTSPSIPNEVYARIDNTCSPLPVQFVTFTATRNNNNVLLKWSTASELNNKGFAVERNISGTWEQIGFVMSQASGGNSQSLLDYSFIDFNASKNITQYRLRQIDINDQVKYSEIRAVRGLDQKTGVIIYPNPGSNGQIKVLLQNAVQAVSVIDMNGKIVRQWQNVNSGTVLAITNLSPGIYCLQTINNVTGEKTAEKFVVLSR